MPVSVKPMQVPDPSTWCRALRRYDRDPRLPMMYASYSVTIRAKPVEIDGRVALTLFFPNGRESAADRALKLGWIDETDIVRKAAGPSHTLILVGPALSDYLDTLEFQTLRRLARAVGVSRKADRNRLTGWIMESVEKRGGVVPIVTGSAQDEDEPDSEAETV